MNLNCFKCKECKKVATYFEKECSYCGAKKNQFSLVIVSALVIIFLIYIIDNHLS
jgi:RNA polymerase subunit RPABC4/transcription elongation factor Spt4